MSALAAVAVLVCVGFAAVALAASSSSRPGPSVSLSAPAEALSGADFTVAGRVTNLGGSGRVVVQANRGEGWRTIGGGRFRKGRFRVTCALTGAGGVRLRAEVGTAASPSARSPSRRLAVRPATPATPVTPVPPAAVTQVAPAPAPEPAPPEPPAVPESYWGAWIGPQLTGTAAPEDMNAVTKFEALAKKPLSLLETYGTWAVCPSGQSCPPNQPFPAASLEKMRAYGAVPMYSWASEFNGAVEEPEYQLADIISGRYDPYIRRWAEEAKAWGHPFFLRFDWEMNGTWFPWGERVNGNVEGEYVTAWQHVHRIFTEVGATNATWVWCPYVNPKGNLAQAAPLYPGDAYVDWTCLDGYNRGTSTNGGGWKTFAQIFGPDYTAVTTTIAPSKPLLIGEVASSENGGSKAAWIEEMFAALPVDFPAVRGLLWFDYEENEYRLPIETSAAATEAFAADVADPRYLANSLGSLPDGPVPVPPG